MARKKLKYRLEALLQLKLRMKRRAEIVLAKALKKLFDEREKLKKLEEELEKIIQHWKEARQEMREMMDKGGVAGQGQRHVNFMRKLKEDEEAKKEEILDQEQVIEEAELAVAKARRDYMRAAQDVQVMEKHKELWVKKETGILNKQEAKKLDELGQAIHQLRQWREQRITG